MANVRTKAEATKFLKNVPDINQGGCLVAAYSFYQNERNAGRDENLQIVSLSDSEDFEDYRQNKSFVEGNEKKPTSADHFGWTFDGGKTIYDSMGKVNILRYDLKYRLLVPKEITDKFCTLAINKGSWNANFERAEEMPKIAEYFGLDFSKLRQKRARGEHYSFW